MSTRKVTAESGIGLRFSLLRVVGRMTNRATALAGRKSACMMEELESRLLLSAGLVAHTQFVVFHPHGAAHPADTASPNGLTPSQIQTAYGINLLKFGAISGTGAGQTIAIIDAYNAPTIVADLHKFDQTFFPGQPDPTLTVLNQNGGSTLPGTDPSGPGFSWAVETSLDVEWAHVIAPNANILLVEASSASNSDLMAAIDTARNHAGVSVVSMSWGESEFAGQASLDAHFVTPAGHIGGVTFVASSGDSGAYDPNTGAKTVSYPAVSANVLGVGGTTLSVSSNGTYLSESGWGNGSTSWYYGGSGGGISRLVSQPAYQHGVVTQTSTYRAVPDVSMDADPNSGVPVIDTWDFGSAAPWAQIGGTSLAAPMWAGVIALADQGRALAGLSSLDGASTLAKIYALPSTDFHDVTTGNNGYAAGSGYDLVTGRGTPIVNLLAVDLAGGTIPINPVPVIGAFTVNPASTLVGPSVTLTASNVVESSGTKTIKSVAFYRESNGTAGLQIGSDSLVPGTAAKSGTNWLISAATTGLAPGTYTYYAVATDSGNVTSTVASTTLTIVAPAPANDMFASAIAITGSSVSGGNVGATKESGEPNVAGDTGGKSVWWNWTATASGTVSVNTHGSSFDTILGVYTGSKVSALALVASNDDTSRTDLTSALTFKAVKGTIYHIVVDGYNYYSTPSTAASGSIVLNLSLAAAPANSFFAGAAVVSGSKFTWTGSNVGASREAGAPVLPYNAGGAPVWIAWTATATRTVSLNTHGSGFDTMLGVYTGTTLSGLTLVASNDDDPAGGTLTSALTFNAVVGTTYHFMIDGYSGATGNIVLNLA